MDSEGTEQSVVLYFLSTLYSVVLIVFGLVVFHLVLFF